VRVGIDVRKAADFGIGTYIRNIVPRLVGLEPHWEWVLFHRPGEEGLLPAWGRVVHVPEEAGTYTLRELFSLSAGARRHRIDLFHAPHYTLPLRLTCPAVVTIHDLIHLLFGEYLPHPLARRYARFMIGRAVRQSAGIITVSLSSARDIRRFFPEGEGKIAVIPNGVGGAFAPRPLEDVGEWLAHSLDLRGNYLLFVGNPKKHKNLDLLLQAFGRLRSGYPGLQLVVVGGSDPQHREIAGKLRALGVDGGVRLFGTVDPDTLAFLYTAATVFVFPSRYEGFGLPPLEAMACGAPVAASNCSSIPEVLGPAAAYFSPESVDSLMTILCRLLESPEERARLSRLGRSRAALFSWDEAARRTLAVYRRVVEAGQ